MRDIKFRVWNSAEMIDDVTTGKFGTFYVNPGSKGNGLDEKDSASLTPFNTKYPDTTPVMQYLDAFDLNGKELCEGDIVQHVERSELSGLIRFSKGGFFAVAKTKTDDRVEVWQGPFMERHCAIIGNAYENPELMDWFKPPLEEAPEINRDAIEGEIVTKPKRIAAPKKRKGGKKQ